MSGEAVAQLDCQGTTCEAISEWLRGVVDQDEYRLDNTGPEHEGIASGLESEGTLQISGSVGSCSLMLSAIANVEIEGDAGDACAHSLESGRVLIRGAANNSLAAFASGGFVVVHGRASDLCGYGLAGADVFVRGAVGDRAGYRMQDGVLVLGNGAGERVGEGMTGGTIYVRGEVTSFADGVRPIRMKDADSMRLSLLLARAGIKGPVKDFKAYRSRDAGKGAL